MKAITFNSYLDVCSKQPWKPLASSTLSAFGLMHSDTVTLEKFFEGSLLIPCSPTPPTSLGRAVQRVYLPSIFCPHNFAQVAGPGSLASRTQPTQHQLSGQPHECVKVAIEWGWGRRAQNHLFCANTPLLSWWGAPRPTG